MSINEVSASLHSTSAVPVAVSQVKTTSEVASEVGGMGNAVSANSSSMPNNTQSSQDTLSGKGVLEVMQKMHADPTYKPSFQEQKAIDNIKKINEELVGANRELQISIHDDTKRIIAKVVDTETKEVVKEIPSEKLLDMFYCMMEYSGLLVDEKR